MHPMDQVAFYALRRDQHLASAARARCHDDVGFHVQLAERYACLAREARAFGQPYDPTP